MVIVKWGGRHLRHRLGHPAQPLVPFAGPRPKKSTKSRTRIEARHEASTAIHCQHNQHDAIVIVTVIHSLTLATMDGSLGSLAIPDSKHFALTHIVYDPDSPLGIPLALLSLSPIFLFVAYFALVIFGRRLSLLLLAAGSVGNEALSLALKRSLRSPRPFPDHPHIGDGYGMPSSHAQAGAFVLAWGVGYALSQGARYPPRKASARAETMHRVRTGIYLFGLASWSMAVAYSR